MGATSNALFSGQCETREVNLHKGDYFIQYTDGVVEAMDARSNEFGEDAFYNALLVNHGGSPQKIIDGVIKTLNSFTGKMQQSDDITMVAVKLS